MGCNLACFSPISSYGPFITGLIAAELLAAGVEASEWGIFGDQGLHPVAQQLAGFQGAVLLLAHGTKVQSKYRDHDYCDHSKQAVQVEGKHIQPDAPLAGLHSTIINGWNPLVGFVKIISDYVIPSISGNASLLVLVTLSGGLIAMLRNTGAAARSRNLQGTQSLFS